MEEDEIEGKFGQVRSWEGLDPSKCPRSFNDVMLPDAFLKQRTK